MDLRLHCGRLFAASSLALFGWTAAATAQELAWQAPVYAQVPSATDFGGQALSASGNSANRLVVGTAWANARDWDTYNEHPRFLAIDVNSGQRVWQRDLEGACATQRDGGELVALFANGDAAVVTVAYEYVGGQTVRFACYARLDGGDGHVIWSQIDRTAPADTQSIWVDDIGVDHNDDLVAIGSHAKRLRTLKLAGTDGQRVWVREDDPDAGQSLRGFALSFDAGSAIIVNAANDAMRLQVLSLSGNDGSLRWRRAVCDQTRRADPEGSPRASTDGSATRQRPLHALADGSLIAVSSCGSSGAYFLNAARLAGDDGHVIWQRRVDTTGANYEIDASGDVILIGSMTLNSTATALARLAAEDGRVLWSTPRTFGEGAAPNDSFHLNTALGNGSAYVWELIGDRYSIGVHTTRLHRYDTATGQRLSRVDVSDPAKDYLWRGGQVQPLPGGDVLLSNLSLYGRWLWLARVQPATGALVWRQREPVATAQPLDVHSDGEQARVMMVASNVGVPGIVVAGRARPTFVGAYTYPYLAKIAQNDGRVLWHWQPEPVVPYYSAIDEVAVDPAGQLIVAADGADPNWSSVPLLAKLDATTGRTLWLHFDNDVTTSDFGKRSIALDTAGNPFVLSAQRLRQYAAADGQLRWNVGMPDGNDTGVDKARVVVDAQGNAIAATPYFANAAAQGLQVAKFRSSDGTRLWLRRFATSTHYSSITALAVLPGGDIAVVGHRDTDDELLARLRGDSGVVVWDRHDLAAPSLLIDRAGQIVMGGATTTGRPEHWQLSRLDAANGATLWRKEFPATSDSGITRIALDAHGDLFLAGANDDGPYALANAAIGTGALRWIVNVTPGASSYTTPVGLVRGADGSVFIAAEAAANDDLGMTTATVYKFTGAFAEAIFSDGFERD